MKRGIMSGALVAMSVLSLVAAAVQGQSQEARFARLITPNPGGNLYVLGGEGANAVALVTDKDGIALVDTMFRGWGRPILDALNGVSDQPVTTIINTDAHGNRSGSNAEFPGVADIIAQENTKANMAKLDAFKGANARFLPTRTFKDRMSVSSGRDQIDLYHFGAAHTNGDTIVVFPGARAAYMGDLFTYKSLPVIDTKNGGSGVAYAQTLARAVAEIKNVALVFPGDELPPLDPVRSQARARPVPAFTTWKDFQDFADFTGDFLAAVKDAVRAGKSVDQAVAGLTLPEKYKDYNMERAKANVEAIYNELTKR